MQPRQCLDRGPGFGALAAQRRDEVHPGGVLGCQAVPAHRAEHPGGPELDEGAHVECAEASDALVEPDGLAHVSDPVGRVGHLARHELTGQVRHDREGRVVVGEPFRDGAEVVEHRVHPRRVERVTHPEPPRGGEVAGDGEHRVLVTGEHDRVGAVHGGQRHRLGQQGQHLGFGGTNRDHRAAGRERRHQPAAGGDERDGVGEREDPGDVRGGDLADRVAEEEVRDQSPRFDEPVQGDLDGEQAGLGVLGVVERGALAEDDVAQRLRQVRPEQGAHLVERLREPRVRLVEAPSHPVPLRSLPGEQHGEPGGSRGGGDRPGAALDQGDEPGPQFVPGGADHRRAVVEGGPGGGQRPRDVHGVEVGSGVHVVQQGGGLRVERGSRLRGDHPGEDGGWGGVLTLGFPVLLDVFQDEVRVGAADPERGDARPARPVDRRPGDVLGRHGNAGPVDVR